MTAAARRTGASRRRPFIPRPPRATSASSLPRAAGAFAVAPPTCGGGGSRASRHRPRCRRLAANLGGSALTAPTSNGGRAAGDNWVGARAWAPRSLASPVVPPPRPAPPTPAHGRSQRSPRPPRRHPLRAALIAASAAPPLLPARRGAAAARRFRGSGYGDTPEKESEKAKRNADESDDTNGRSDELPPTRPRGQPARSGTPTW